MVLATLRKLKKMSVAQGDNVATYTLNGEEETAALAARLAGHLQPGDVLLLSGDLGAGKSVFARALIRALTGNRDLDVPSPTFTLLQSYDTPAGSVWHFDLYRLEEPEEIYELGWEDALYERIVIVEWPQRLGGLAPPDHIGLGLELSAKDQNQRRASLTLNARLEGTKI